MGLEYTWGFVWHSAAVPRLWVMTPDGVVPSAEEVAVIPGVKRIPFCTTWHDITRTVYVRSRCVKDTILLYKMAFSAV